MTDKNHEKLKQLSEALLNGSISLAEYGKRIGEIALHSEKRSFEDKLTESKVEDIKRAFLSCALSKESTDLETGLGSGFNHCVFVPIDLVNSEVWQQFLKEIGLNFWLTNSGLFPACILGLTVYYSDEVNCITSQQPKSFHETA